MRSRKRVDRGGGDVFAMACPSRAVLSELADKWSLLVIDALADGPVRNNALIRRVEGISQKMLTQTLTKLAALNLVERHSRPTVPPYVDYRLTALGQSLRAQIAPVDRWVEDNWHRMRSAKGDADGA